MAQTLWWPLLEIWLPCLLICLYSWQEVGSCGSLKGFLNFFLQRREWKVKKGGGGWREDRRGLGRNAMFQQARNTTWSLITHKALCNPNHRLGCIIGLNKTWPSLRFTPLPLPCCYKTFAPGNDILMPLLINWTNWTCCCFHWPKSENIQGLYLDLGVNQN